MDMRDQKMINEEAMEEWKKKESEKDDELIKRIKPKRSEFTDSNDIDYNKLPTIEQQKLMIKELNRRIAELKDKPTSALDTQIGGSHYTNLCIQPWQVISKNNIGYFEGTIISYVMRYKDKGGIEDLKKARHTLDYLIETLDSTV